MPIVRGFDFPGTLWYLLDQDTWVRREPSDDAIVGITALGAHISGEFMEFIPREPGTVVERGRSLGALEMSKVIRSTRSPVAGEILEVNPAVRANPGLINSDPFGEGWLVRLRPSAWESDIATLVTGEAIAPAVEAYMSLLVETFGIDKPGG
jgi:glycine cleavage system H protein